MDDHTFAARLIRQKVWGGFYSLDEVWEALPTDVDEQWLDARIAAEFAAKHAAEATWPAVTTCDRLNMVFEQLNAVGIVALHQAGYTQSDGITDISEVYHSAGGAQSSIHGYCFYHEQDVDNALVNERLFLTFGDIRGTDEHGLVVAQQIKAALEAAAFVVEWDGTINTRLWITNILWQRRSQAKD